jgi:hypothetical protein
MRSALGFAVFVDLTVRQGSYSPNTQDKPFYEKICM